MNKVMKFQEMSNIRIEVKPHHLFRYPSEWDPRQNGKTKGGYLEGKIQLPQDAGNLRVVISTHPETPHQFKEANIEESPNSVGIHPTLIHVVRKGKGNRRFNDKEPVPNIQHWQQEFVIVNKTVLIRNKTSEMDEPRYDRIERIEAEDEMFEIQDDFILPIGKEFGELNMIILIPKTEKRASHDDVCLSKLLKSRIKDPAALKFLTDTYTGKNSLNLKKVKLRVDVFSLESNTFLGSSISGPVFDTASKAHGAMDLHDATPLRSCAMGGRKIVMIAEFGLAKDVEPRFQLYDQEGRRLKEEEDAVLVQPNTQQGRSVSIMKETIVFITPPQPHAEIILENNWRVKLVARRSSDGLVSKTKFDFDLVPHDYYSTCIFCEIDPDKQALGSATIPPMRDVARPGLRKRQMSGTEVREFSDKPQNGVEETNQPAAKKQNTDTTTGSQTSQTNSAIFTINSPNTVIHSISRLPVSTPPPLTISRLPVSTPPPLTTRPILNSLRLPTSMAYLNFPLNTKNGHLVPTLASLPRIAPKPVEKLVMTSTTQQTIKTEVDEDHGVGAGVGAGGDVAGGGGGVPVYDLNKSQTVRVFPVDIGGEAQDSSLLFPHTDGSKDVVDEQ